MSLRERLTHSRKSDVGTSPPSDPLQAIQSQVHQQIVNRLAKEQGESAGPAAQTGGTDEEAWKQVAALAREILDREHPGLPGGDRSHIIDAVCDDILGYGPTSALLRDPDVSEIMVNGPRQIYAERNGRIEKTPYTYRDAPHVMAVVERMLAPVGRRVDESCPMVDARLPNGSRINVVIPPISLSGPAITIRKFRAGFLDLESLLARDALTQAMAVFLRCCVESRLNLLVIGGTGRGKTTLLNALSSFVPAHERIITIEDAAELQLRQGHVLSLEARPPNLEGRGAVTIRDLVRNALRMRPDRIVIGEVRGAEALDLLQAMNTGHEGCLSTLHANSPRDALSRLETMAMMAGLDLPVRAIREQIAAAVDLFVHLERFEDGSRRIARVTEVHGMERDVIVLQDIFAYERSGVDARGRVTGRFVPSGIRPAAVEVFQRYGLGPGCWSPPEAAGGSQHQGN